jgi:hypothetical protein
MTVWRRCRSSTWRKAEESNWSHSDNLSEIVRETGTSRIDRKNRRGISFKFNESHLHLGVKNVSRPARVSLCIVFKMRIQVTWRLVALCSLLQASYWAWSTAIRHSHQSISFGPHHTVLEQSDGSWRNSRVSPLVSRILSTVLDFGR